jgi:tetratricopeptide (TPR) repeat protein
MASESPSDTAVSGKARRLRGWKEIGRWFGVDERTVKRWESSRGLPVHRVPGEPRAPVFAYERELREWAERDSSRDSGQDIDRELAPLPGPEPKAQAPRRPWLTLAVLLLVVSALTAVWLARRVVDEQASASERVEDVKRLAGGQVAALNDQLDSQPGTVAVRAALAKEAVQVLGRVAALPNADPELKREAAEGYRRLAVLQNAIDRPSLRDRGAARGSLSQALKLLEGDGSADAATVRARAQIELARQVSAEDDQDLAKAMLKAAEPAAMRVGGPLKDDWLIGRSVALGWSGDYRASADVAALVSRRQPTDPVMVLTQLRALDSEAESLFYLGELEKARATYAQAVALAEAGAARWPADSRLRWGLLRQQWNLGSTFTDLGRPADGVPMLKRALEGWQTMARADPSDEAVQVWVWATRLSYGQALAQAGRLAEAIPVLSAAVAERRAWHSARPDDPDRRRLLMKAEASFADALAKAGRAGEACLLYAEARGVAREMEKAGQLTGYDRQETLRILKESEARFCGA